MSNTKLKIDEAQTRLAVATLQVIANAQIRKERNRSKQDLVNMARDACDKIGVQYDYRTVAPLEPEACKK